jgi:hypothetical protein
VAVPTDSRESRVPLLRELPATCIGYFGAFGY